MKAALDFVVRSVADDILAVEVESDLLDRSLKVSLALERELLSTGELSQLLGRVVDEDALDALKDFYEERNHAAGAGVVRDGSRGLRSSGRQAPRGGWNRILPGNGRLAQHCRHQARHIRRIHGYIVQ